MTWLGPALLWLAWFAYCVGVVPTWCAVYVARRTEHSRIRSWTVASGMALIWPAFVWQFRRWQRNRNIASEAEEFLRSH